MKKTKQGSVAAYSSVEIAQTVAHARRSGWNNVHLAGSEVQDSDIRTLLSEPGVEQLQSLDLARNQLSTVPREIGQLTALETLQLYANQLSTLSPEIGQLTALRTLDLSSNQLSELPREIGQLTALRTLDLSSNQLSALPREIGRLTALRTLALSSNQLSALPREIGHLTALTTLALSINYLSTLPREIGQLTAMKALFLDGNQLSALPPEIGRLTALKALYIHDNDRLGIPPEILGPTYAKVLGKTAQPARPADILAFYFRTQTGVTRPLNEVKILVVGLGAVGKTSLINYLLEVKKADPSQARTQGVEIRDDIEVRQWFPGGKIPASGNSDRTDESLRANIWDFGGQEIMHATHRFFLTERSLYLIVLEPRKDGNEQNLRYWLRLVESFGGDSPILVVINKCEPPNDLDLNKTGLMRDYPGIRDVIKTSCTTGRGIEELKLAIANAADGIKHVKDRLPESYFQVKTSLEVANRGQSYQTFGQYQELCRDRGVVDEKDQARLLHLLHALGTVLNYGDPQDPYHLHDTNVLNPRWVTDGVYRILNCNRLMAAGGVLERRELESILNDPERFPPELWDFILGMMEKFELCVEFPGSKRQRFLIPELLQPDEPEMHWHDDQALRFEYHYQVLPEGLISRFIVRMHHALTKHPTYWRTGVILQFGANLARVRADMLGQKITVSIMNPERTRREALAVIRNEFAAIHATMPKLPVQQMIPWPEDPSVLLDYEELLAFERDGHTTVPKRLADGSTRTIDVSAALDGVEAAEIRRKREGEDRLRPPERLRRAERPAVTEESVSPKAAIVWLGGLFAIIAGVIAPLWLLPDWQSKTLAISVIVILVCVFTYVMTPAKDRPDMRGLLDKVLAKVPTLPRVGKVGTEAETRLSAKETGPKAPKSRSRTGDDR